jgi:release factor glutamine methyltransferase
VIGALRREIAARLGGASETPALDARLLVAHALGTDPSGIVLRDEEVAAGDLRSHVLSLAARRIAGEPVARIVGEKEFWGLRFRLSPDTLVPRPDTETVVSTALAAIDRAERRQEALRILDIGTGSGALLLALLSELPRAFGIGTDISPGAASTAAANAARLKLADRARFVVGNWADALAGGFDIVVANPPYIASPEIDGLPVEVRRYDPHIGLDGGADGLLAYRALIGDLGRLLSADGEAFFEVGAGQAEQVAGIAERSGFVPGRHHDLAGIERVVSLKRMGSS